jgi:uncharacterized protein YndB with AHSA1/START domain
MNTMNPADAQKSIVDEEAFSVRRTLRINAGVDAVWAAVTEPEHISRWFGVVHLDGRGAGASGTIAWPDQPPVPIRVEVVDPKHSISYRWTNVGGPAPSDITEDNSTEFTFTLEPLDEGTQLTVVESGFGTLPDPLPELRDHGAGWNEELDKLVVLLEENP